MSTCWSEICRTYIFKNIYGWKIYKGLNFLNFQTRNLDQIKKNQGKKCQYENVLSLSYIKI